MGDTPQPSRLEVQELFFRQWWKDMNDGITLRTLYETMRGHEESDKKTHDLADLRAEGLSRELQSLRERVARLEQDAERDAEERTGRHAIAPPAGPSPPVVVVERSGREEKASWPPKEVRKFILKLVPYIATALSAGGVGALVRHLLASK